MTNYDPQYPGITGATRTMHTAASGDSFSNNGDVLLYIENSDSGSHTCTLASPGTPVPEGSSAVNDAVLTIAAGAKKFFGPFKRSRFNDANGEVQMTWSSTTGMTWAAVAAKTN